MTKLLFIVFLPLAALFSCKSAAIGTVENNVCKTLNKRVVLYAIFVDSDATHPWSKFDINSTMDSIKRSADWMEQEAKKNGVSLEIQVEFAQKDGTIPFKEKFKYKSFNKTLFRYTDLRKGINLVDKWSDNIARDVARTLPKDTSKIIKSKNRSNNRERMIAKLRNHYMADDVAVMYFINNYFENEISAAFHTASDSETEFAVVSTKQTTVIAHEFLHLFGAWDLYVSPFDRRFFMRRKKRRAMRKYPDELMAFTHKRNINTLSLSPLTKYLIGWENSLDTRMSRKMFGRRWKLLEY